MPLGSKLKYLREARGWSRVEAAKQLGLKYTTYVGYENDERDPGHVFLIYASKFYGVSVDFLLDTDNLPEMIHDPINDSFVFFFDEDRRSISSIGNRIKNARENLKMTAKDLAIQINVSPTRLSNWENGKHKPNSDYISLLSETLNVSTDYLLGITADNQLRVSEESSIYSSITNVNLTSDEQKLLSLWRQASPEGQQAALAVLSTCVDFKKRSQETTGAG